MMNKIDSSHLQRAALVYIRQSSMSQVRHNLESQKLQYELINRAKALGWKNPIVVDQDLGKSASGGHQRSGFEFLLEEVCAGRAGAIFAVEASRLSRCGSEWHRLLEFCLIVDTLIIDPQAVYDPKLMDDRFLLGLKGTMSEMEVSMLRARTRGAALEKARRGELFCHAASGFVLLPGNKLVKDPNRRVRSAIETVFKIFDQLRTIGKTTKALRDLNIEVPVAASKNGTRAPEWSLPQYSRVRGILTNPIYAGAYVYGRTRRQNEIHDGVKIVKVKTVALEDALVILEDHHEGYISWEQFKANQEILQANRNTAKGSTSGGAPRQGAALLAGLLRCGNCGCRLVVRYYGDNGTSAAYFCNRHSKAAGEKRCLYCGSAQVDEAVEAKLLEVICPLGMAAALEAHNKSVREIEALEEACLLRLEQRRYEAQRAQRQYDLADPENRLVSAELERRWNQALEEVLRCEMELARVRQENQPLSEEHCAELSRLGEDFARAWNDPRTSVEIKKRIVRAVVEEVVVRGNKEALELAIHWKGGDHSELTLPRSKAGRRTDPRTVEMIAELRTALSSTEIAQVLNQEGVKTGAGLNWTAKRVESLAKRRTSGPRTIRLQVDEAARRLGISSRNLKGLITGGKLRGLRVCSAAPILIEERDLSTPIVQGAVAALKAKPATQPDLDLGC